MGDIGERVLEEGEELGRGFEQNARARAGPLRDEGEITDKLDRVAEALLGVDQKGLVLRERVSIPLRLGEIAFGGREVGALPAGFVGAEAFDVVAVEEEGTGPVPLGGGEAGSKLGRAGVVGEGIVESPEVFEEGGEIVVS